MTEPYTHPDATTPVDMKDMNYKDQLIDELDERVEPCTHDFQDDGDKGQIVCINCGVREDVDFHLPDDDLSDAEIAFLRERIKNKRVKKAVQKIAALPPLPNPAASSEWDCICNGVDDGSSKKTALAVDTGFPSESQLNEMYSDASGLLHAQVKIPPGINPLDYLVITTESTAQVMSQKMPWAFAPAAQEQLAEKLKDESSVSNPTPVACGPMPEPVAWRRIYDGSEGTCCYEYNEMQNGEPLYSHDSVCVLREQLLAVCRERDALSLVNADLVLNLATADERAEKAEFERDEAVAMRVEYERRLSKGVYFTSTEYKKERKKLTDAIERAKKFERLAEAISRDCNNTALERNRANDRIDVLEAEPDEAKRVLRRVLEACPIYDANGNSWISDSLSDLCNKVLGEMK
jgi:hypothetical protein